MTRNLKVVAFVSGQMLVHNAETMKLALRKTAPVSGATPVPTVRNPYLGYTGRGL